MTESLILSLNYKKCERKVSQEREKIEFMMETTGMYRENGGDWYKTPNQGHNLRPFNHQLKFELIKLEVSQKFHFRSMPIIKN